MNKANECTCPSGDGSLRWPCPKHPAVEQTTVATKLTFINGRPAMCGCQVEYSSGGGEYSDVIYVTLCVKHSGFSAILDLVATNRIALTPEYEGQWHADLYLDREMPLAKAEGATPAEAVLALMSAERIDPKQESVEQAGGDERAAFEAWMTWLMDHVYGRLPDFTLDDGSGAHYVNADVSYAWTAWQARAALAQPSPAPVCTTPTGENCPGDGVKSCKKCPEQPEAERPEVERVREENANLILACASLDSEKREMRHKWDAIIAMRDAALAWVAELERQEPLKLSDDVREFLQEGINSVMGGEDADMDYEFASQLGKLLDPVYAAPVAQTGHSVQEGWKLVPLKMTEAMITAFGDCNGSDQDCYSAMLADAPGKEVPQAWLDVQAERRRQVEAEGWTPKHDDEHSHGQMARASACYALAGSSAPNDGTAALLVSLAWPWDEQWWKPSTARRDLVKACALALAEIERLDRAAADQGEPHDA
ncbi:hypothetical protein ACSEU7_27130 [Pseudomonas aeruginosa]